MTKLRTPLDAAEKKVLRGISDRKQTLIHIYDDLKEKLRIVAAFTHGDEKKANLLLSEWIEEMLEQKKELVEDCVKKKEQIDKLKML